MEYDLDEPAIRRLVGVALAAHPAVTGRFLALAVSPDDVLADVARTVERRVLGDDFSAYERESLLFLVIDRTAGRPAAAGRVIAGGGRTLDEAPGLIGLGLSTVAAAHGLYAGKIWDLIPPAVLPAYGDGRTAAVVNALLYRTFVNAGQRAGIRHVVTTLGPRAYRNLALLGIPLQALGGSGPFARASSPSSRAAYADFTELVPAIARQAELLGESDAPFVGEFRGRGLRRLLARRIAARMSAQVSSGDGLDDNIRLPGLERRRGLLRRH
jgi:hypothetical protein